MDGTGTFRRHLLARCVIYALVGMLPRFGYHLRCSWRSPLPGYSKITNGPTRRSTAKRAHREQSYFSPPPFRERPKRVSRA